MDVTSRESILEAKKVIEAKEGKLHVLVNKCVQLPFGSNLDHLKEIAHAILTIQRRRRRSPHRMA